MQISSTVERNDDRMTEENDLHHKRRRIDVDNHALNLSSNKYDDNIVDRDFKDLSDVKNEVVRESVIFGETYNILVDSLKQELMASLEAIAKNSAKRILEELIYSQANVAGTRSKNNEISETRSKNNEISETRSSNNDNNLSLSSRISQQIAGTLGYKILELFTSSCGFCICFALELSMQQEFGKYATKKDCLYFFEIQMKYHHIIL